MTSDSRLPILIFAILVGLISLPLVIEHFRERRRPVLAEARVVTATSEDPVFRDGSRHMRPGEDAEIALALRVVRSGKQEQWLAPVPSLVIDGRKIDHLETGEWPEEDLRIRVFWFSVESANLGGRIDRENAAERLRYRSYLAPELGRGLLAAGLPEIHNDDHIGTTATSNLEDAGTFRLYARIEIVEEDKDVRPLQATSTLGIDSIFEAGFPALYRSADLGNAVHSTVGELFRLPGFEPSDSLRGPDHDSILAFGRSFVDLVAARIAVSSWTLAAEAVSGDPSLASDTLRSFGELTISEEEIVRRGRPLHWENEVEPGDLLSTGDRWIVLLADEGNGVLDTNDSVLHCWGRPPERTTLFAALDPEMTVLEHLRYEP
jgi:hypothetical protein